MDERKQMNVAEKKVKQTRKFLLIESGGRKKATVKNGRNSGINDMGKKIVQSRAQTVLVPLDSHPFRGGTLTLSDEKR